MLKKLFGKKEVKETVHNKGPIESKNKKKKSNNNVNNKEIYRLEKEKSRAKRAVELEKELIEKERLEIEEIEEKERKIAERRDLRKLQIAQKQEKTTKKIQKQQKIRVEEPIDMFGYSFNILKHGEIVEIEVLSINKEGYDVQTTINNDASYQPAILLKEDCNKEFTIGEVIKVLVYKFYADDFYVSEKRVAQKEAKDALLTDMKSIEVINGKVISYEDPFFEVEMENGFKARVFKFNIGTRPFKKFEDYIGMNTIFEVKDVREGRNGKVFIELTRSEIAKKELESVMDKFEIGQEVKIQDITINRGGIETIVDDVRVFIPFSEIAHNKSANKDNVAKFIEEGTAAVIIEKKEGNIVASIKQLVKNPLDGFFEEVELETEMETTVIAILKYGILLEIEPGVKGLLAYNNLNEIQRSEMKNLQIGDKMKVTLFEKNEEKQQLSFIIK